MNAIEMKGVTKAYEGFYLGPLDLTLPGGCIMGLIGENGAGKSTTIRLLLNMIQRDGGTIALLGKDNSDRFDLTKEDIGVVLDEVGISECLTPLQVGNVMRHTFRQWDDAAYAGYLKKFDLPEKKKFKTFSRGMKMKLGIAVALSHRPKLLILDEATSGLDPVVRDEVIECFAEFTREEDHAVLISSHIVSDLEKLCDYIAFLHKGQLLLCEEKDRLYEQYGIVHCTEAELHTLPAFSVLGKKVNPYGVEAIVRRDAVSAGWHIAPVDIEQLFVLMMRGMDKR